MTPNHIEVLIHCHVSPQPHPRLGAPAVRDAINEMIVDGLIEIAELSVPNVFRTTARGVAHIRQLCELEYPRQAWVNKSGEVIE